MYSVVLLMAITTGGESADGCRGCRGCYCGCYCGGGCRGCRSCGCYGYGCYGCGCYSRSYYGCGCYGGCRVSYGCYSYSGCGCYAGCVTTVSCAAPVYRGCVVAAPVGCAAGHLVSSQVISGTVVASAIPTAVSTATIVVSVPTDAKVTIDGQATTSTSATRYFETPSLGAGQTYAYTFEATFVKDGAPMKVSKKVDFKAGDLVRCDLSSETSVASR